MQITGTLTLSNGTKVSAEKDDNGIITWAQTKMIRHGNSSATQGTVMRKATDKQAATFVPDAPAETAVEVEVEVETAPAAELAVLAEVLRVLDETDETEGTDVPEPSAAPVLAPLEPSRYVSENLLHMALHAASEKARAFWSRKAGLLELVPALVQAS